MSGVLVENSPVRVISAKIKSPVEVEMETVAATTPAFTFEATFYRERSQIFSPKVLEWYWYRRHTVSTQLKNKLLAIREGRTNINEFKTSYGFKGGYGELGYGRVFSIKNGSMETLDRVVRNNLYGEAYWDVDMVNSQPNLLIQLAKKVGYNAEKLEFYVKNRDDCLEQFTEVFGSRDQAKDAFISAIYGGKVPELMELYEEMQGFADVLKIHEQWKGLWVIIDADKAKKDNPMGSFLALVGQTLENVALSHIDKFLMTRSRSVDALEYDGCKVLKNEDEAEFPSSLLRDCEVYVSEKMDYTIGLKIKDMELSIPQADLDAIKIITPEKKREELIMEKNLSALAELYALDKDEEVMYSPALKTYYIYDRISGLWTNNCDTDINNDVVRTLTKVVRGVQANLPIANKATAKHIAAEIDAKHDAVDWAFSAIRNQSVKIVRDYLPTFVKPDFEPMNKFNTEDDLYPCKNGVYSFSQRRLMTYKKEYYFTFKVPIEYKSNADTSDIEKAMTQWFMGNANVISFMKYWLGYCLTPSTKRQEFLTVWGETAGNGKSTLFSDLFPKLMTGTSGVIDQTLCHTLDIKALLTTTGANNDTIFNLVGKRYAYVSEPKLEGKQKVDNEMIKRLTGESRYSVSAKYKNEITFQPMAKLVALCNKMFKVDVEDKGILRRILVAEMNTRFVDEAEYERSSKADKKSGRVQIRDDSIVDRLTENLSGVLKYFLEGASDYVENPRRSPPDEMFSSKMKAVKDLDDMAKWIKGYIIPEEGVTLSLRELKTYWRDNNVSFEIKNWRDKGFNKEFFEKCRRLGLNIKFDEDRSDEGKIIGARLWDESLDSKEDE
jgi:phage/plasmid-associated DNA primase